MSVPKRATYVDRKVAENLTALRKAKGRTQTELGNFLGISFQQVQKYEKGENRISAGRLFEAARFLEVPVTSLYPDEPGSERIGP